MITKYSVTNGTSTAEFSTQQEALTYAQNMGWPQTVSTINEEEVSPIPASVTPRQIRDALSLSGISVDAINSMISSLPSPQKDLVYNAWEYSTLFERDNPHLNAMAPALGLTPSQVDQLFILAATL